MTRPIRTVFKLNIRAIRGYFPARGVCTKIINIYISVSETLHFTLSTFNFWQSFAADKLKVESVKCKVFAADFPFCSIFVQSRIRAQNQLSCIQPCKMA
jgi:hypothetical protein